MRYYFALTKVVVEKGVDSCDENEHPMCSMRIILILIR